MAQCGIKKYDSLPSRVGLMDVDAMRSSLCIERSREKILIKALDRAVILNKKNKRR